MKKNLVYFFLFFLFCFFVKAQNDSFGVVNYQYIINNPNGVSFANPYQMYYNDKICFYFANGSASRIDNQGDNRLDQNGNEIKVTMLKGSLPKKYVYKNIKDKELIFKDEVSGQIYTVKEDLPVIEWKLLDEKKKIGSFDCQKAIGNFRGREFTVWFTEEIPIAFGPWKLGGLPGLIINVKDATGKYEFRAIDIDLKPQKDLVNFNLKEPVVEKFQNFEEYKLAQKNAYDAMISQILASMPRGTQVLKDCDFCPDPKNYTIEVFE